MSFHSSVRPGRLAGCSFALLLLLLPWPLRAQHTFQSSYLQNPAQAIGYVDSCARFWLGAYDPVNGGVFTDMDSAGRVITAWGMNKGMQIQSRDAYGFTRAFMLTGNELYLQRARQVLEFMEQHAWDQTYGGWFSAMDRYGSPQNVSGAKSAYDQHYALLGLAALYEATRDSATWNWLMRGYGSTEQNLWDVRTGFEGYYDHANRDWSGKSGKSFNATVDAITTHALALYLLTGEEQYKTRLREIMATVMQHLVPSMDTQAMGFVELYTADWASDDSQTMTIMGHVLKTAWCLARAYQVLGDTAYLPAARKLALHVWQKGYDHNFGGPYKDYNRMTGQMLLWGIQDTAKAWWQMEQAVTGGLQMFAVTGDSTYLRMADESLDFFMKYFVDHKAGEVFQDRTRYGQTIPAWGTTKGSSGKGGYHSIELGYYTYLYGNLLLSRGPVTLYYNFAPAGTARDIRLVPIAAPSGSIRIQGVQKFSPGNVAFNATAMTLHLEPSDSGKYAVTFEPSMPTSVNAALAEAAGDYALGQNWPNPWNPVTTIGYTVGGIGDQGSGARNVKLTVYNLLGQEVAVLVNEKQAPGRYTVRFNGSKLASGVYLYRLQAGSYVETKRMVLLR